MKVVLCFVAAILLVLSNSCSADVNENAIFQEFNDGWKQYAKHFIFKGRFNKPQRFDFGINWLCPIESLFDLTMKNVVNVRELAPHYTTMQLLTENNVTVYNHSPVRREIQTSEYAFKVREVVTKGTSNIIPFTNGVVVRSILDGHTKEVFTVGAKDVGAHTRTADNNISYEKLNNTESYLSVPSETVTVDPHSQLHVSNYLYEYNKVKNYLLDIELDRARSKVKWNNCRIIRLFHFLQPSTFLERDTEQHVQNIWRHHQNTLAPNGGRVELVNGKMILRNVPVQMIYNLHKVETVPSEQQPI